MAKRYWQSRGAWISIGIIVILLAAAYFFVYSPFSANASFKDKDGLLIVSNPKYEIAFHSDNGAIAYLKNKDSVNKITLGNREKALWWAFMQDDTSTNGKKAEAFSYDWNSRKAELVFHYGGQIKVDVTARFGEEDNRIYLNASVDNQSDKTIKSFRFPYELKVDSAAVQDAILPMLPGAKLKDAFFKESNSFQDQYPGVMFASYLGLRTSGGNLAVYDLNGDIVATTDLGFKSQVDDSGKTGIVHNYKTWIDPKKQWNSPSIVLEIGDYETTIAGYRELNKMDDYRSLADKLGEDKATYFQLPFYKTDISAIKDGSWSNLTNNYLDKMNYNGVIHLVGFQKGGHDENYPDFIPPDPQWGGEPAFKAFVKAAKDKGNRVVPYTNMSWWGINSPTLSNLPAGTTMEDLIVAKDNNAIMKEDYGKHSGYVVNTGHPFFLQRTAEEHKKLTEQAGFDGIFEDQWGIRNSPYVFNKEIPEGTDPSSAYFQGVRNYFDSLSHNMYMEDGTDVLADDAVGFMGSTYLWDQLGYRKNTSSYTDYYPLSGMLLRDKVMLFHHDLAAETMTDDQDMLRWNLAMGYNLSVDFFNGVANPWVDTVGVFQKFILSQYADSLVERFEQLNPTVTRTDFGKYAVTANWNKDEAYVLNDDVSLAPGGYDVSAGDGNRRAGNYVRLNGLDLDAGDHNLIEVREKDAIRIYQPIGSDTTLKIRKGKDWPHASAIAFRANGTKIADLPVKEEGDFVIFDYVALIKEQRVAYVELGNSKESSKASETFEKVKVQINAALLKKVFSTSNTAEAFPAELAVDGDPYTYWESTAKKFPQSLTLDLGEARKIGRLVLKLPPQDAWEARDQQIEVLTSSDGENFTALLASKAYTFEPKESNEVNIELGETNTRFVRLTILGNTGWPAAQVAEFEAY
ncbi:discoidin domain-containing protein [Cohnella luojiensis]|uniref:Discoidin domain-containing protein n=1 Tax=Cohnella luojiensis TaxID=652876 RepID=A0A4Y8MAZ1_9BACL|nr:discoidin domain-containing protein [Cohnella luojiensis]TFE31547.1 discoidin domain-containing protein [Cohnella luojiensis]